MNKLLVLHSEITVQFLDQGDFISLSDMARFKDPARSDYIIQNWLRNRGASQAICRVPVQV
jgi:hypothetical protein